MPLPTREKQSHRLSEDPILAKKRLDRQLLEQDARRVVTSGTVDPTEVNRLHQGYAELEVASDMRADEYLRWVQMLTRAKRRTWAVPVVERFLRDSEDVVPDVTVVRYLTEWGYVSQVLAYLTPLLGGPVEDASRAELELDCADIVGAALPSGAAELLPVAERCELLLAEAMARLERWRGVDSAPHEPEALESWTRVIVTGVGFLLSADRVDEAEQMHAWLLELPVPAAAPVRQVLARDTARWQLVRLRLRQERWDEAHWEMTQVSDELVRVSSHHAFIRAVLCSEAGELLKAEEFFGSMSPDDVLRDEWLNARAEVAYNRGDYNSRWRHLEAVRSPEGGEASAAERQRLVQLSAALLRSIDDEGSSEAQGLMSLALSTDDSDVAFTCLRMLVWAADRTASAVVRRCAADVARELVARHLVTFNHEPESLDAARQLAFVAVLARQDAVASVALTRVDALAGLESADRRQRRWLAEDRPLRIIRAHLAMRSNPELAVELLTSVHTERPHDIDLRVGLLHARLRAEGPSFVRIEATELLNNHPGHVYLRILRAEAALQLGAVSSGGEVADSSASPSAQALPYLEAAHLFAGICQDQARLVKRREAEKDSSDVVPMALLTLLLERGLYSVLRARECTPGTLFGGPSSLRHEARCMRRELRLHDELHARDFNRLLRRQTFVRARATGLRLVTFPAAVAALFFALWPERLWGEPSDVEQVRLLFGGLAVLLLLWPYVRKLSIFGVEVEKPLAPYVAGLAQPIELDVGWILGMVVPPASAAGTQDHAAPRHGQTRRKDAQAGASLALSEGGLPNSARDAEDGSSAEPG